MNAHEDTVLCLDEGGVEIPNVNGSESASIATFNFAQFAFNGETTDTRTRK
jgi:hypothetical protein